MRTGQTASQGLFVFGSSVISFINVLNEQLDAHQDHQTGNMSLASEQT